MSRERIPPLPAAVAAFDDRAEDYDGCFDVAGADGRPSVRLGADEGLFCVLRARVPEPGARAPTPGIHPGGLRSQAWSRSV